MSTPAEVAADFRKLARDNKRMASAGARGAAQHMKLAILTSLRASKFSGGLRNMGKGGTKLSASYKVSGNVAVVSGKPAGPWSIVESGAVSHPLGKPGHVLKFTNGEFATGVVRHPGMHGSEVFSRGVVTGEPGIVDAYDEALGDSLNKAGF